MLFAEDSTLGPEPLLWASPKRFGDPANTKVGPSLPFSAGGHLPHVVLLTREAVGWCIRRQLISMDGKATLCWATDSEAVLQILLL